MPPQPCPVSPGSTSSTVPPPRTVARSGVAVGLSFLVAFFPKCPMCWAAYMSALGFAGLAQIPYPGYLFPVLVAVLGLHLLLAWRQVARVGYGPPLVSLAGMLTVLLVRWYDPDTPWALYGGMLLMLGGALWHSFSLRRQSLRPPPSLPASSSSFNPPTP